MKNNTNWGDDDQPKNSTRKRIPGKLKGQETEADPRENDETKTIAISLFVFILLCMFIAVIKLRYGGRKRKPQKKILEPTEDPINIRFKSLIGRGSFGVVWKASLDDVIVAVKMCSIEKQERWEKEREIMTEVKRHPNVMKMIGSEVRKLQEEIALLLIIEFVDNGDLRTYLTEETFHVDDALFLLKSLFDGLAFLHSNKDVFATKKKQIAHRDIKSSNILISSTKGCVIADFGLALILEKQEHFLLHVEAKVGTARYMAPEKLCGAVDRKKPWTSLCLIDIYASALVAYEILSRCSFSMNTVYQGFHEPDEFMLPFADAVGSHPSNDDMKRIIVDNNMRPSIPNQWSSNQVMDHVTKLIIQCWDGNPHKRLKADEVLQQIKYIYLAHELNQEFSNGIPQLQSTDDDNFSANNHNVEVNSNSLLIDINEDKIESTCL